MWRLTHDQKYRDWGWDAVQVSSCGSLKSWRKINFETFHRRSSNIAALTAVTAESRTCTAIRRNKTTFSRASSSLRHWRSDDDMKNLSRNYSQKVFFFVSSPTVLIFVVLRRFLVTAGRMGLQHRSSSAACQECKSTLSLSSIKFALKLKQKRKKSRRKVNIKEKNAWKLHCAILINAQVS